MVLATICVYVISAVFGVSSLKTEEDTCNTNKIYTNLNSYISESTESCIEKNKSDTISEHINQNSTTEPESADNDNVQYYTEQDAVDIAKVLYRECRGVPSVTEQACVVWTILNRVDYNDSTIYSVIRAPNQFAFSEDTQVDAILLELANDVLERWNYEKNGGEDVGRVLPKEYRWFNGYDGHNHFRDQYDGSYNVWDYSVGSPYRS